MKNKHLLLFFFFLFVLAKATGQDSLFYGQCITASLAGSSTIHSYILPEVEEGDILIIRVSSTSSVRPCLKFRNNGVVIDESTCTNSFTQILEVVADKGGGEYSITIQDYLVSFSGGYQVQFEKGNSPLSASKISCDETIDPVLPCGPAIKCFYFGAEANSIYEITVGSTSSVRPCIEVRDGNGVIVIMDCENSFEANVVVSAQEGICYFIFVYDYFLSFDGGVNINLVATFGDCSDECPAFSSEICDNGIDDDGNDLIDCADPGCKPLIQSVTPTLPLPEDCDDGQIAIAASGQNLEYNITGGLGDYQSSNTFANLPPGAYNVRVRNAATGCFSDYPGNPVVLLCDPPCETPDFSWLNAPVSTCPESPVTLCLDSTDFNFNFTLFQNGVPTGQTKSGTGEGLCFDPIQIGSETTFGVIATLKTDDQCTFVGPAVTVAIGDLSVGYSTVPETGSEQDGRIDLCFTSGTPPIEWAYSPPWGSAAEISTVFCPDGAEITGLRSEYYLLTLEDAKGCTGKQVIKVDNTEKERTGFPEKPLLTPNGDGKNDVLFFGGLLEHPQDNELVVYSRYGSVLYQAAPYGNNWDCTYQGAVLPAGVYYYTLKVEDKVYSGFVTIAR